MTEYAIAPATEEHDAELARTMRAADRAEAWAVSRLDPLTAVKVCRLVSREPRVGLADGRVVCMFGVDKPVVWSDWGRPWLLGAEELPQHARAFLRMNRGYLAEERKKYSYLLNWVDARNKIAVRWLGWLGFEIGEAAPYGVEQRLFYPFMMRGA